MVNKERADIYLVKEGFFPSQERAKAAILAGKVFVAGKRVEKAGALVEADSHIEVKPDFPYVSRGGLKLESALKTFHIDVEEKVVLDAGAGAGGFTDCLLKAGAKKVIAVDVGYGDFAFPLRQNPQVLLLERTNFRHLPPDKIPQLVQLITMDLSFISVKKVINSLRSLLTKDGKALVLVKPQFEAEKGKVGRKGVVRDPEVHKEVLKDLWEFFEEAKFEIRGVTFSPLLGREGNIEFWMYLSPDSQKKTPESQIFKKVEKIVEEAHQGLVAVPSLG